MEWFVITEEEHLGPFEEDTLISMYEKGEITGESFVWQEGWEEAVQFSEVFEDGNDEEETSEVSEQGPPTDIGTSEGLISGLDGDLTLDFEDDEGELTNTTEEKKVDLNLPPDLPPLPTEEDIQKDLAAISGPVILNEVSVEEEITDPVSHETDSDSEREDAAQDEFEDEFDHEFGDDQAELEERPSKKKYLVVVGLVIIVILGVGAWFFSQTQELVRPNLMSIKDFERLKATASLGDGENKFSFALSKDKKNIWIATNNPLEGNVLITMKGIKNKILGEVVEIKGTGKISGHLIKLEKFNFIVGSRFIDGIYEVSLKSTSPLEIPLYRQYFHENNRNIDYKGKILVSSFDMNNFKKQLQRFLKKKFQNSKSYWQEIIQKYQTVKMITDQIKVGFEGLFTKQPAPWEKRIINFEAQYRNKWGQFFTEFVKANEASYEKLSIKKFDDQQKVLASYNNLSNLAIRIGETAMVALERLQEFDFRKNSKVLVEKLKNDNSLEFVKIIEKCDEKIRELSE